MALLRQLIKCLFRKTPAAKEQNDLIDNVLIMDGYGTELLMKGFVLLLIVNAIAIWF